VDVASISGYSQVINKTNLWIWTRHHLSPLWLAYGHFFAIDIMINIFYWNIGRRNLTFKYQSSFKPRHFSSFLFVASQPRSTPLFWSKYNWTTVEGNQRWKLELRTDASSSRYLNWANSSALPENFLSPINIFADSQKAAMWNCKTAYKNSFSSCLFACLFILFLHCALAAPQSSV